MDLVQPDDSPDGRVHALRVSAGGEDGDAPSREHVRLHVVLVDVTLASTANLIEKKSTYLTFLFANLRFLTSGTFSNLQI
jgi:hypothetical protein